jgi:hypothetical protein
MARLMGLIATVASTSGNFKSHRRCEPRAGTKRHDLYRLFHSRRGKPINIGVGDRTISYRIEALRNDYGQDIQSLGNGYWVLAGEWNGDVYVKF